MAPRKDELNEKAEGLLTAASNLTVPPFTRYITALLTLSSSPPSRYTHEPVPPPKLQPSPLKRSSAVLNGHETSNFLSILPCLLFRKITVVAHFWMKRARNGSQTNEMEREERRRRGEGEREGEGEEMTGGKLTRSQRHVEQQTRRLRTRLRT
ncbi:hypothetical protein WMY93_020145 [Mugilogobius chulae]|uniref:Uncharacterized protein n=1 Tax=Mugilogobius chulae TaxID=88201 RepID=A0AAW0NR75_9GOBI